MLEDCAQKEYSSKQSDTLLTKHTQIAKLNKISQFASIDVVTLQASVSYNPLSICDPWRTDSPESCHHL